MQLPISALDALAHHFSFSSLAIELHLLEICLLGTSVAWHSPLHLEHIEPSSMLSTSLSLLLLVRLGGSEDGYNRV